MLHWLRKSGLKVAAIKQLIRTDSPVIFDVGANDGQTTLEFLQHFPNAKIFAFEPDPRAIAKFRSSVVASNVSLFEIALGAKDGLASFHMSDGVKRGREEMSVNGWDKSGSLLPPKTVTDAWPWLQFNRKIDVQVVRLDTWAAQHNISHVDFLWADVQGGEGDLIRGGNETLTKTDFFYTEYSNDEWYEGQPSFRRLKKCCRILW